MKSVLLERLTGVSGVEMGHICLAWVGRLNSDRWFTWFSNAGEGMKHVCVCVRERQSLEDWLRARSSTCECSVCVQACKGRSVCVRGCVCERTCLVVYRCTQGIFSSWCYSKRGPEHICVGWFCCDFFFFLSWCNLPHCKNRNAPKMHFIAEMFFSANITSSWNIIIFNKAFCHRT